MKIAVIIPALDPEDTLLTFVQGIMDTGLKNIIIVNDGSQNSCMPFFDKLERIGCIVYHIKQNMGKGYCLKYGLKKAKRLFPDLGGVITAEANKQHRPEDLLRVAKALNRHPHKLVLGVRHFNKKNSPLKFRISFFFSKLYFHFITQRWHRDTRTVLRGIPSDLFSLAETTEGNRYEYEFNFLISAVKENFPIHNVQVSSRLRGSHLSHFRPFYDTLLLFKTPIKFAAVSLSCYGVDIAIFTILTWFLLSNNALELFLATVLARLVSGALNFTANKKWSFRNTKNWSGQAAKYGVLFVCQMLLSWILVTLFSSWIPIHVTIIKMAADLLLFVANYFVQKNWVFKNNE